MKKILRSVLLSSMFIYSAVVCTPKSDNNDSLSLVLLGVLASANNAGEDLSCQNKTLNWSLQTSAATLNWTSVRYGNGLFAAIGASGGNRVMTGTCE
ncbi:hypothetical protein [Leptospira harrisiae]|uniref:hypothetical protein n=1 Tax=Leptospira harrisiae TaxID=2023189 RepID=UPI001FAF8C95|nr:hypothetical protein [Leptospira harrisiae]